MKSLKGLKKGMMLLWLSGVLVLAPRAWACTAIVLEAQDGSLVYGRTAEWAAFDLESHLRILPRGYQYQGHTPDGDNGMRWTGTYGVAGLDMVNKPLFADAINEKGLMGGLLYHPGFAQYAPYEADKASISVGPGEVMDYLLSTCSTVDEVRKIVGNINKIRVVPVVEPVLGFPIPMHIMFTDPGGACIVVEWSNGEAKVFNAPLRVMTNAPTYDWHITNLRNYINMSAVALPGLSIKDLDFKPLGAGSGMIGLPGDFTPVSRFVRAVAFTQTARPLPTGYEAMYEVFRILDNFNVPLGAAEGASDNDRTEGMRSSTQWTTAVDLNHRILYYHTQNNRQVREVDIGKIDFSKLDKPVRIALDDEPREHIDNRTDRILEIAGQQ